ncbi:MAG: glycosyltransferase [Verrucomicrobia bacterium]|nr:glycosyltransferase [Verrucomicrobiota bacterium]
MLSADSVVSTKRPLVSFVLITYNQENLAVEALRAALRQTYSPLEIIVSDDCSKDKTFEALKQVLEIYTGPHRIILNKNEKNLGITPNFLKAVSLSSGNWIVAAAGDDISVDTRVEVLMKYIEPDKPTKAISSSFGYIDDQGKSIEKSDEITARLAKLANQPVEVSMSLLRSSSQNFNLLGATACWHHSLFKEFPGIISDPLINEDMVLTWRAKMLGSVTLTEEKLVLYRRHTNSVSSIITGSPANENIEKKQKKSLRVRATLIQIMADVDYAYRKKIISERQRSIMCSSLIDFMFYHTVLINWASCSFFRRLVYIFLLWRPGKMRPGFRLIFN